MECPPLQKKPELPQAVVPKSMPVLVAASVPNAQSVSGDKSTDLANVNSGLAVHFRSSFFIFL